MSYWSVSLNPVWLTVLFYTWRVSPDESSVKNYVWKKKIRWDLSKKRKIKSSEKACSAKKLLTLSKRQFLLLPSCVSAHLAFCFKGASQSLAMPTAQRTEKGMRHSMLQVINPRVCTLLITAASWTLLRRMSSSKKALVLISSVKGQYLTPNSANISGSQFQVWKELPQEIYMLPTFPSICFLKL